MVKNILLRRQLAILLSALVGTTCMTLYSYCLSLLKHKNFNEPQLLGQMSHRLLPFIHVKQSRFAGWITHYTVGLLFAEIYAPLWRQRTVPSGVRTGLVLGGLSGIAAILIWKFTLSAHPLPPEIDFPRFAGQLFVAHLVFAVAASVVYAALNLTA